MTIILLAIGLSMDSFAIAIGSGTSLKYDKFRKALKMAACFGILHFLMVFAGWLTGEQLARLILKIDHWIGFGILTLVSLHMLYEGLVPHTHPEGQDHFSTKLLFTLAFATSIDAFAVGITFPFIHIPILAAMLIIGATAGLFSFAGVYIGQKAGRMFPGWAEVIGAIILFSLGLKMLLAHL
jgi:manganese efflux pump family protein